VTMLKTITRRSKLISLRKHRFEFVFILRGVIIVGFLEKEVSLPHGEFIFEEFQCSQGQRGKL
jgi:hypothetical protein